MGFRDDEEALRGRVQALEQERDQLRAGVLPLVTQARRRFLALGIVTVLGTGAILVTQQRTFEREASAAQSGAAACAEALDAARSEAARARSEAERAEAEARAAQAAIDELEASMSARAHPAPREVRGLRTWGHVTRVRGVEGVRVGNVCAIEVRYETTTSDCHAAVDCGSRSLYPRDGEGFFPCEVEHGAIARGVDPNPTAASGDPQIDVALDRRTLTIADTEPAWSVTLEWPMRPPGR